jgi:hypothetical protein
MSDAITAANIITDAMFIRDMGATLTAIRARRDYEGEIAHLRAWLEWYERRHHALTTALQPAIDAAKAQEVARERLIAKLQRENQELRSQNTDLAAGKKAAEDKAQDFSRELLHWRFHGAERPADRA